MVLNTAINIARGRSSNISQHHLGQMLDEFALHPDALGELRRICALPIQGRIEPLRRLVRDEREQTAPSMLLLLLMRQTGMFAAEHAARGAGIPKRIVHYWHDGTPPPDVQEIMASWRQKHPDYQHVLLDDAAAENFLRTQRLDGALHAFHRGTSPGQRGDILRLAYLSSLGGFFVDADDRCLAGLDAFIPRLRTFAGYQENYGTIGVNFMGAAPGHPVVTSALEQCCKSR